MNGSRYAPNGGHPVAAQYRSLGAIIDICTAEKQRASSLLNAGQTLALLESGYF
jgi:hypothetical protein